MADQPTRVRPGATAAALSAGAGVALVTAAMVWPPLTDTFVNIGVEGRPRFAPLHANWDPRITLLSVLPVLVGIGVPALWPRVSRLGWRAYLAVGYAASWAWVMSLAHVDGTNGLGDVFTRKREYLWDAQRVTSIHDAVSRFTERIDYSAPDNWQTHVAGHPPGALLSFVLLDRIGVTDPYWVGFVVVTIACTCVVTVALTVRVLAGEEMGRRVVPWLVLAPAAIWFGVSADAAYAAVAALGLLLLAVAGTTAAPRVRVAAGVGAGVVLGWCVYLSYGLVLLGILALAVVWLTRRWSALAWAVGGALCVVAAFTFAGFAWWNAYPVLAERYQAGIASERPGGYWWWANVAAWTFTVGLATWSALPAMVRALREDRPRRVVATLGVAGLVTIALATASGMSKAEVERIWLPFTVWILIVPALLPRAWYRPLLVTQVATALLVQHLLVTRW